MSQSTRCPSCGALRPDRSTDGPCTRCLSDPATLGAESAPGPAPPESLAGIAASIGGLPRVALHETDVEAGEAIPDPTAPSVLPGPVGPPGKYRLSVEIARGGMGAVLRGRDLDLGREVALKVLLDAHKDRPELVRRFVEEAQIGGQLQHPGVVPIYELGGLDGRRPFFAMKLVKGRTLAELLRERSSPAEDLPRFLSIFESTAQTVAYVHARGVIHRDLKPSNIMVGSFGEVQVMDWGLAKVLTRDGTTDNADAPRPPVSVIRTSRSGSGADDSQAGSVLGTPGYMAPEQARGEVEAIDERADVFGLGAILCEVLTGEPAFTGRSPGEALRKSGRGELAEAFGRLDGCGAGAELIGMARDCLAPEPEDRPRDAGAVADRITAYLRGVQDRLRGAELARVEAQARAEEAAKRARVERERRRLAVGLAAAVMALAAVGVAGAGLYQRQRAAHAAAVAKVMGAARTLRDQARERPEDPSRWRVALAAVEQAEGTLGGDAAALAEWRALRDEVRDGAEAARRDRALLDRLDDIRTNRSEDDGTSAASAYADAFREAGLDLSALATAKAAASIRARPHPVAMAIAAALDDYAMVLRDRGRPAGEWQKVVDIARGVDPDLDRDRLRTLFSAPDTRANLEPLRDLARRVDVASWPVQSLVLLASTLDHAGDPGAAADLLGRARISHPGDVWINYDLGTMLRRARPEDTAEAIRAYSIARALRPEIGHDLAHLLEQSGRTAEAVAVFEDLARRSASIPRHLVCLGHVHESQGQPAEAHDAYRRAVAACREMLEGRPADLALRLSLGNALNSLGDQDGAVAAYREGLRIDPDTPALHDNLGIALGRRGQLDDAIVEHREAIRIDPKYANAHTNLAMALMTRGDLDGALAEAREAVRLEPDNPTNRSNLGAVLEGLGDHAGAVAAFREAVRLKPDLAEAHTNLGIALEGTGDTAGAAAEHRLAMRLKPDDPRPPNNLSALLGRLGDADGAIAAAREAIRRDPKYGRGYKNLGVVLEKKGDLDGAIASAREAIRLRPDDAECRFNLGNALRSRGDLDGAVAAYREAIRMDPKRAATHSGLGGALLERKDYDGALASYREAIRLAPADPDYRYNLGLALAAKGDSDGAASAFREALRIRPDFPESLRALALAELGAGRVEAAIDAYRKLIRAQPGRAESHYDLAGVLLLSGRSDEAIRSYRAALRLRPDFAEAHCNLGHALTARGSYAEALEAFRRGHELGSKRPGWPYPSADWVREAERMKALEPRLDAVLRGEDVAAEVGDRMTLAQMCTARSRPAAAVRLWARIFADDPKQAEDRDRPNRYNAACSAALAGGGRTKDDPPPDASERTRLRAQALVWLRAELDAWSSASRSAAPPARSEIRQTLQHWKQDPDLAAIRDDAALKGLPDEERTAFRALWSDVDRLLGTLGP